VPTNKKLFLQNHAKKQYSETKCCSGWPLAKLEMQTLCYYQTAEVVAWSELKAMGIGFGCLLLLCWRKKGWNLHP